MKRKQKRTHILGALIFVALVVVVGFGLAATGNLRNPLSFLGEIQHQVSSGTSVVHDAGDNGGPGQGRFGTGGGPDTGNNSGFAWDQIGGVFSDLWVLSAIVACYILVQQTLRLIGNHFWARKYPQPTT